jgi:hypothetical protein
MLTKRIVLSNKGFTPLDEIQKSWLHHPHSNIRENQKEKRRLTTETAASPPRVDFKLNEKLLHTNVEQPNGKRMQCALLGLQVFPHGSRKEEADEQPEGKNQITHQLSAPLGSTWHSCAAFPSMLYLNYRDF